MPFFKTQSRGKFEYRLPSTNSRLTYFIINIMNPVIIAMPIMPITNAGSDRTVTRRLRFGPLLPFRF